MLNLVIIEEINVFELKQQHVHIYIYIIISFRALSGSQTLALLYIRTAANG